MVKFTSNTFEINPKQLELVADILKKEGFEDAEVTIEAVGDSGDNFMANVKRIIAVKDGRTFKMVAKIAPSKERSILSVNIHMLFYNEYLMYSQVLPKFTELEEAAGIPASERLRYAKCYGAIMEEPLEFILFEDLQVPWFVMLGKTKYFSNDAIKMVLENLAKLHSCSYALKNQEPDTFIELREALGNFWMEVVKNENAIMFFNCFDEDAMAVLISDKYKAVLKKYGGKGREYTRDLHKTDFESRNSVILHGDCWSNNVLFRLEGTTPINCIMIDYQISRVSSPVADLFYMIFSCTNYEDIAKYFNQWIDYYYSELDKNLNKFGLKSDFWYPREQLDADLKRHAGLGLHNAFAFSSMLVRGPAEAVKMRKAIISIDADYVEFEKALKESSLATASEAIKSKLRKRVIEAIDSMLELGFIHVD